MSSIASGPGIASGPIVEIGAVRPVASSDHSAALPTAVPAGDPAPPAAAATVATSSVLDPGAVPVDQDRVATIKKAIETNNYPIIPFKISDAMIAAGLLLRIST